jgi:hypothetical protein
MWEDKFKPYLENPTFIETLNLVRKNSSGKFWIIGGFLYKNLARSLYGGDAYEEDIDFIVEQRKEKIKDIPGWQIYVNNYGVENYQRTGNKMSFTDIRKAIRVSGLKNPTIDEFIQETPLNIQSIAYDMEENMIIGHKGIQALESRIININNQGQADFYAQRKGKKIEEIISDKARELGFNVV